MVRRFDLEFLAQIARLPVEDQDAIIICDHREPALALRVGRGGRALGQVDLLGKRDRRGLKTDDNQADQHYETDDHCGGEGRDQPPQEPNIGGFFRLIMWISVHGPRPSDHPRRDRRHPAAAP